MHRRKHPHVLYDWSNTLTMIIFYSSDDIQNLARKGIILNYFSTIPCYGFVKASPKFMVVGIDSRVNFPVAQIF